MTFSLPVDVVSDLDRLARHMGCSRSAALTLSLRSFLDEANEILGSGGSSPADEAMRRLRGDSAVAIEAEFEKLRSVIEGMDASGQYHLGGLRDQLKR